MARDKVEDIVSKYLSTAHKKPFLDYLKNNARLERNVIVQEEVYGFVQEEVYGFNEVTESSIFDSFNQDEFNTEIEFGDIISEMENKDLFKNINISIDQIGFGNEEASNRFKLYLYLKLFYLSIKIKELEKINENEEANTTTPVLAKSPSITASSPLAMIMRNSLSATQIPAAVQTAITHVAAPTKQAPTNQVVPTKQPASRQFNPSPDDLKNRRNLMEINTILKKQIKEEAVKENLYDYFKLYSEIPINDSKIFKNGIFNILPEDFQNILLAKVEKGNNATPPPRTPEIFLNSLKDYIDAISKVSKPYGGGGLKSKSQRKGKRKVKSQRKGKKKTKSQRKGKRKVKSQRKRKVNSKKHRKYRK